MIFPYNWNIKNGYPAKGIEYHGSKVFGTFICGGGSTMGYKLAGFDHLGGVEVDPQVAEIYKTNHSPIHLYQEDIRAFNDRQDLPKELYSLDLLDGSPPCSSFSMAGNRDKDWGKNKQFREGQVSQRLDDLVFVYVETIKKLQPKIAILENVKGLIQGNAKSYAKKIKHKFEMAGYKVQVFLLNGASMGIPQRRERVFFLGVRNDFDVPKIKLNFNCEPVIYKKIKSSELGKPLTDETAKLWRQRLPTDRSLGDIHKRKSGSAKRFSAVFVRDNETPQTLCAGADSVPIRHDKPNRITSEECCLIGSFPLDYNFKKMEPSYLIGMSVPPVMTAQIANQIYKQWLRPIKQKLEKAG